MFHKTSSSLHACAITRAKNSFIVSPRFAAPTKVKTTGSQLKSGFRLFYRVKYPASQQGRKRRLTNICATFYFRTDKTLNNYPMKANHKPQLLLFF